MFNIGISRHTQLWIVCTGPAQHSDWLTVVHLAADLVKREGWRSILFDLSSIPPALSADELADLARYTATSLSGVRLAIVARARPHQPSTEAAARQAGGMLRYFEDHASAVKWMRSATA